MAFPANAQVGTIGGAPTGTSGASIPLPAGVTPDYTTTAYAYLSARPPVLGVGQTLLVNVWITPGVFVGNYFVGYVVTITKPDGTTEKVTLNSYNGDATSWFEYVPTTIGTYKLKFDFPGGYFPAANYYTNPGAFFGSWHLDQHDSVKILQTRINSIRNRSYSAIRHDLFLATITSSNRLLDATSSL